MVIGFIGLGNMASAMVRGIAAAQLEGVTLCGHNPHPEKAKALTESCGLRLCASNAEVLSASDVVVLAVKPQILEGVLAEIAPQAAGRLFLSVAAGKELAWLEARLGHEAIIRAMPNINAVVGASVTGWCANDAADTAQRELAARLLGTFGTAVEVPERFMGIVGAIGGAAPAYKDKTYKMTAADVCAGDDKGKAAEEAKKQSVSLSANYDTGEDWDGMRDLDHNSANVQNCVKAYLDLLLNDLGYAGVRYDMTKGYAGKFTGLYNKAANPTYSVGEYFDGNKTNVINWLNATKVDDKIMSAAFDFPIRYSMRDAANNGNWSKLANGGLATDVVYKRYAVTFLENHDTEKRSDDDQDPIRKDTLAANAYMIAMPGTPCVFYKHWTDCKQDIKNMILVRYIAGIHNESRWSCTENSAKRYVVTTTGKNMKLRAAVGTTANAYTPTDDGWALAAEGYHWRYFLETSLETAWPSLPSGTYYNEPTVTLRAISANADAKIAYTLDGSEPTAKSNVVANGTAITLPEGNITLKVGLLVDGNVSGVETRSYEVKSFKPYPISVYVNTENVGWDHAYFWTWGGDETHGPANKDWPGDKVATATEHNGKKWFAKSFSINTPTDYVSFVFAKDKSTQTADVSNVTATSYF